MLKGFKRQGTKYANQLVEGDYIYVVTLKRVARVITINPDPDNPACLVITTNICTLTSVPRTRLMNWYKDGDMS